MTMVPAEIDNLSNLQQQHQFLLLQGGGGVYGGCCVRYAFDHQSVMSRVHGYDYQSEAINYVGSDLASSNPMAEDESRTNSLNEAASISKENNNCGAPSHNDDGWLQLGLGSQVAAAGRHEDHGSDQTELRRPGELIELDLLPGGGSSQLQARAPTSPLPLGSIFHVPDFRAPQRPVVHSFSSPLFFQQQLQQAGSSSTASFPLHQEVGWAFRPLKGNVAAVGSSSSSSPSPSSSSLMAPFGSYFARPFQVQGGTDMARPTSDFRVVDPPRRPNSGIWFVLQASQNQAKEPFLPQIPKSYLRIKDGRMTVRLLMKYLVNKLGVDSESEIEITCRGQQLQPFLTLQHVRDNIWSPRDALAVLPQSSTADHVMVLHYARSPS